MVDREERLRPKKGLGQNFLVDAHHQARVVAAAELAPTELVLEVGPGRGELTAHLAAQAGRVVAVELDDRLIPILKARFASDPHVSIVHADILQVDIGALMGGAGAGEAGYKIVANLPYYITGAAIRHFLESHPPPALCVLTVQKEVADRMVAKAPDMSLLAVSVQYYCRPRIVERIPAGAFSPPPKVDSAVVRLNRLPSPSVAGVEAPEFFRVVRAGFSQRRKQLRNSLAAGLGLPPHQVEAWLLGAGIDPKQRAENLTVQDWGRLVQSELPRPQG